MVNNRVVCPLIDRIGVRSVGVAALKKGRFVGLYLDRIHTKNDTVFDEDNIRVLTECGIKLASFIKE